MDDKKVNNPTPTPDSSDTFKSTNIYASKASNQADYFAHVKPTFQDKLRAKLKNAKTDPSVKKRLRKIIIIIAAVLLLFVGGLITWLIIDHNNQQSAVQEASEQQSKETLSITEQAAEAASGDNLDDAIKQLDEAIANSDNPEVAARYSISAAELERDYDNVDGALDRLLKVNTDGLDLTLQYSIFNLIGGLYEELGDNDNAQIYYSKVESIVEQLNARGGEDGTGA